jgi:hypothetical protein
MRELTQAIVSRDLETFSATENVERSDGPSN